MPDFLIERPLIRGKYLFECHANLKRYQSWHDNTKSMWPHLHKWLAKSLQKFKRADAEQLNSMRGFDIVRYIQHFQKLSKLQSPAVHVILSIYDTENLDGNRWRMIVDTSLS